MDGSLYIFVKGCEVNNKPKFSTIFWHKAGRSTKLRLFIWLHAPYHPLQLQLRYNIPGLGFYMQQNQSGRKSVQQQVGISIMRIFYTYGHSSGPNIPIEGQCLTEQ